jgi:AcrR family transcriptional regulator
MLEADSPERARSRGRIHQAALRLFAERGAEAVSVSDLAAAAGIARGTIYNNVDAPEDLFIEVASGLADDMIARTEATMAGLDDPAARIATGLRLFVRRAHEEPHWGRFLIRFGFSHALVQRAVETPPQRDIARAIKQGRFKVGAEHQAALPAMLAGAVLASIREVVNGRQTWRNAGSAAAELFLRACGIGSAEARRLANSDLPDLAPPQTKRRRA